MKLLTTQQIADLLRIDRKTVGRWADSGRLPHTVNERGWRMFDPDVVRPFFAQESARHLDDMAATREPVRRGIDLIDTNEL